VDRETGELTGRAVRKRMDAEGPRAAPGKSDDDLMRDFQGGCVASFEELVSRYRGALVGFLRAIGAGSQAEDLAQEAFIRVYEHHRDYIPMGTFRPWLYRIARNLLYDSLRERVPVMLDLEVPMILVRDWREETQLASMERKEEESETWRRIEEVRERLPESTREVLFLRYSQGLTVPEIAEVTGLALGTVKSRIHYALKRLKKRVTGKKTRVKRGRR
jgi:RNA polymerase sigma-70 factor (ECF subfamily)